MVPFTLTQSSYFFSFPFLTFASFTLIRSPFYNPHESIVPSDDWTLTIDRERMQEVQKSKQMYRKKPNEVSSGQKM